MAQPSGDYTVTAHWFTPVDFSESDALSPEGGPFTEAYVSSGSLPRFCGQFLCGS
jgi:hypothetical protein